MEGDIKYTFAAGVHIYSITAINTLNLILIYTYGLISPNA